MYYQELKQCGIGEFKIKLKQQNVKEEVLDKAQRRCQEIVKQLQYRMRKLIDYEGIEETIIQNVESIIMELDEMIEINSHPQKMGWIFDWNCINRRYTYGVKDNEGKNFIGGNICIYIELEDIIGGEIQGYSINNNILRITDVNVFYEEMNMEEVD